MWVGFDEYGKYAGHQPYLKDESGRALVIKLAREKVMRIFWNERDTIRGGNT